MSYDDGEDVEDDDDDDDEDDYVTFLRSSRPLVIYRKGSRVAERHTPMYGLCDSSIIASQPTDAQLLGNGQTRVYPGVFQSNGGGGQARLRQVPAHAPICRKLSMMR